jgi:aerobic C4-dicarboxylate transport protein
MDGFIKFIKMIIAPIIFCTVVTGIARMQELLYFEVVSTLALIIGLLVVHIVKSGVGMNVDTSTLDPLSLATYRLTARSISCSTSYQPV